MESKRNKPVYIIVTPQGMLIGLIDPGYMNGDVLEYPRHFVLKPDPSGDRTKIMATMNPMIGNPKFLCGIKNYLHYEVDDQEICDAYFTAVTGLFMPSTDDVLKANKTKGKISLE